MTVRALWLLGAAVLLAAGAPQDPERVAAAIADYRAGRHDAAFAALQAELAAAGDLAPAELRWNLALAALRVQRSADAEQAVQPWLAEAAGARRADAEFVLGMACCQRAERAALAARLADAEPTAWAMALSSIERAVAAFGRADQHRGGWPEAQRNAERARARWQELRDEAQRAAAAARKEPAPEPLPVPPAPTAPGADEIVPELAQEPLLPGELEALSRRLQRKDEAKRALRQQGQRAAVAAGERGW